MKQTKVSIRFFNDREVRAVWSDEGSAWWFSVVDVIAILTESKDPRKYWSVLKTRLKREGNQLTTKCSQLKLLANDGKRYLTDCLLQDDLLQLASVVPSRHAMQFTKWLITGENTLDNQSREKAYSLWDSTMMGQIQIGTVKGLQQIHSYIFGGLYDFAGKIRTKNISKAGFQFAMAQYLDTTLATVERMPDSSLQEIVDKYVEMNIAHPFMEGNGRSTRIWLDMLLKARIGRCVDWSRIDKKTYMDAMVHSVVDTSEIQTLISGALTDKINDREMFMKGIDYSYYYESEE